MAQTVQSTLKRHQAVWSGLKAFADGVTELGALVAEIEAQAATQTQPSGDADAKKEARLALAAYSVAIAGAVHAYATKNDLPDLAARTDYSETDLAKGRPADVISRNNDVLAAATENLAQLGDHGVTEEKLTKLGDLISAYRGAAPGPRNRRTKVSAATGALDTAFDTLDDLFKKQLDRLVLQFRADAPDFYAEYQAARVIVDNPGSRGDGGTPPTPPSPPAK